MVTKKARTARKSSFDLVHAGELGDDFVAVALVDEEALPLGRVGHLETVGRHQRIEERVVLLGSRAWRTHTQ